MISTVTTTTASTVTTATSLVAGFGLIATTTLITLLITKELAGAASENSSAQELISSGALVRVLNVGIPLSMVFIAIVLVTVLSVL